MNLVYYLLWSTRNGQKLWEGPFLTDDAAWAKALQMHDCHDPVVASQAMTP